MKDKSLVDIGVVPNVMIHYPKLKPWS